MLALAELKTAAEVREHYRRLRERTRSSWLKPESPPPPPKPAPPRRKPLKPVPTLPGPLPAAMKQMQQRVDINEIIDVVCEHFHVTRAEVCDGCRTKEAVLPRYLIYYLARELINTSTLRLGRTFRRDHSSVVHGIKKIGRNMTSNADLAALVAILRWRITENAR